MVPDDDWIATYFGRDPLAAGQIVKPYGGAYGFSEWRVIAVIKNEAWLAPVRQEAPHAGR